MAQSGVVYLALAHELPVIASEVGGLRDLMNEFKIGETFRQHTPAALAAAIYALEDGGATQSQLADEFRAAKRRYSWQESAAATLAGYVAAGLYEAVTSLSLSALENAVSAVFRRKSRSAAIWTQSCGRSRRWAMMSTAR